MASHRIAKELETIAAGQRFHDSLVDGLNSARSKRGLSPCEPDRELFTTCVEAMLWAVRFDEIDAAARELYGDRFEGLSICEVHRRATDLAQNRKNAELAAEGHFRR